MVATMYLLAFGAGAVLMGLFMDALLRRQARQTDHWYGEAMRYLHALGWDRDEQERKRRQRPDRRRVI